MIRKKNNRTLENTQQEKIPKGWIKTKIDNICELIGGGTPSRQKSEYFNGDIIWLTPTEIPKNQIIKINNSREKITELGLKKSSAKIIPINSVLLTSRANIGYVAIAGTEVTTNQGFASFVCNKTISPYFLAYWLFGNKNLLKSKAVGTTFKEISKSKLRELEFKLPPLLEQHRIVLKIESIFTQIDAVQERLEVMSSQIKSVSDSLSVLKNNILKQAFEGKLMPQDSNDEPAEILLKKINNDPDRIIFEKKNVPKGWIKTKIDNICELIGGGTPSRQKSEYFNGDIIWLTPTEIPKNQIIKINNSREKITELGLKKSSAKIIPINSVLLTSRANIGYVAIAGTEVTTNQGFASFVCNKTISPYFLAYWLFGNKNLLKSKAVGTTFKEISKSKLRELEFKLPPLLEQHRIVLKIESIFDKIDANFIKTRIIDLIHNYDYLA